MRIPRPVAVPRPEPEPSPEAAADAEAAACEAAATIACRTSISAETLGADGKAAVVLTLLGIMFTVLARFGPELGATLHGGIGGFGRVVCGLLLLGFVACGVGAVVHAFRTISPRFRNDKPSLAFFAEVARLDRDEYVGRVESMTMRQALGEILLYNHTAARICAEKYKQLRRCLRCFEAAAGCWLVLAAVLAVKSLHG